MEHGTASLYRRFAEVEARGVSSVFFDWATSIAGDEEVLALIETLPPQKRQPNLVFAAARLRGVPVGGYSDFRAGFLSRWPEIEAVVLERSTQTNEAGRCAVLLPVLSRLEGPLALIEAGAAAGLCLYPDRYSYRYDTGNGVIPLDPLEGPSTVVLPCRVDADSVPDGLPDVVSRTGVDLNPLDVSEPSQVQWLETLVWPEHGARRARLRSAATITAADPPALRQGDLIETIPELIQTAPHGARVVVFHSAVLVYLPPERRAEFVALMRSMPDVTWISNEGEQVLPEIREQVTVPVNGRTILSVNGRAHALVGPHGQSYERL